MGDNGFSDGDGSIDAPAVRAGGGGRGGRRLRRAGDRARPEPEREAQHRHDRRRAAGARHNLRQFAAENIVALCDVYEPAIEQAAANHPQARRYRDFRKLYDHANDVRRRGRQHHRAHARLRHAAGLAAGQARLLREAADAQRLGGPDHPRGRREGQGRDPDGHPDPRQRQLPPRRRADPDRRDRPGAARRTSGSAGPGAGSRRRRPTKNKDIVSVPRAARPSRRRSRRGSTGTSGSAPRRRGRSTRSTSPGRSGTAGGTSATAR